MKLGHKCTTNGRPNFITKKIYPTQANKCEDQTDNIFPAPKNSTVTLRGAFSNLVLVGQKKKKPARTSILDEEIWAKVVFDICHTRPST